MAKVLSRLQILLHANTANYRRDIKKATSETKSELKSVSTAAAASSKKIDSAFKSVLNFKNTLAAVGVASFAASIINTADSMQDLASKIRINTESTKQYAAVLHSLRDIARQNITSYTATVSVYADARRALKQLGKSQADTLKFTNNLTTAMRIGGGAAESQAAALTQLGQALSSGTLRGDEFNSVAEQAPILLDLLSKKLGVAQSSLKDMAAEGKLTAETIYESVVNATDVLQAKAAQMPATVTAALSVFRDEYSYFVDDIMNQNTMLGQNIAQVVLFAADNFDTLAKAAIAVGVVYAAHTVANSGLVASLMGVASSQLAATKASIANAMSTKTQIAAVNNLHKNMMLLRLTKTHYINLTKQAIATTIAYGKSLNGLSLNLSKANIAAMAHNRAIAAGNAVKKTAIASSILTKNAVKGIGGAFTSVAKILARHPLLVLATVLTGIVIKTKGLQGALDSLGDALSVVAIMTTDLVSVSIDGFTAMWDSAASFLSNLVGGSDAATTTSGNYFSNLFAGTEGGFVGMIQVAASVLDDMLSAVVTFAKMSWHNLNQMVISIKNAFRGMGNLAISVFEGIVNAGISRINFLISGMNLLIKGANAAKQLFGFEGNYSEVNPLGNVKFGRIAYEDTNYVGYSESYVSITASRDYVDSAIQRSQEVRQAADNAAGAYAGMGAAATAMGDAADKAGGRAASSAKEASTGIKELLDSYYDYVNGIDREIYELTPPFVTELYKVNFELENVMGEFRDLPDTLKDNVRAAAKELDEYNLANQARSILHDMSQQAAMLGKDSNFEKWLYNLNDAHNVLSTINDVLKQQILDQAEQLDIAIKQQETVDSYKSLILELRDDDTKRLDTLKEQLTVLDEMDKLGTDVSQPRSKLLDGIAITEYKSAYSDTNAADNDYLKLQEIAKKAKAEHERLKTDLQILREQNLIDETEYQEKLLKLEESYAVKRGQIERDLAISKINNAESLFGALANISKGFVGEQNKAYRFMFAVEKGFSIARSIMAIKTGIAQAVAIPFPANLAAMGSVAAATANIVSDIQAIRQPNIAGQAHDGLDYVPKEGTYLLDKGEAVIKPSANRQLINFLNEQQQSKTKNKTAININFTVENYSNESVHHTVDDDGRIRLIIGNELKQQINDPYSDFNSNLQRTYNLQRSLT